MEQDRLESTPKRDAYKVPRLHKGWETEELTSRQKAREGPVEMIFDPHLMGKIWTWELIWESFCILGRNNMRKGPWMINCVECTSQYIDHLEAPTEYLLYTRFYTVLDIMAVRKDPVLLLPTLLTLLPVTTW